MRTLLFLEWLRKRPERRVVVAAHSGFLLSLLNAAVDVPDEGTRQWFGTGEMRTCVLTPMD